MTARKLTIETPVRQGQRLRMAIDGPTGSGKTWTALQFAEVLDAEAGEGIVLIDTERGSGRLYADAFGYKYSAWLPPYDPRDLADTIRALADEWGVIIVDSLTHFWRGEGGTLDIVDHAATRSYSGNRFAGWQEGTPAQDQLVDALLTVDAHVLATMRSKMAYVLDEANRPTKVGLQPLQRDDLEYEFTLVVDMDLGNTATVTKSRCSAVSGRSFAKGRSAELIGTVWDWLQDAEPMATRQDRARLKGLADSIADDEIRLETKRDLIAEFGPPEQMTAARMAEALAWLEAVAECYERRDPAEAAPDPEPAPPAGQRSARGPRGNTPEGQAALEASREATRQRMAKRREAARKTAPPSEPVEEPEPEQVPGSTVIACPPPTTAEQLAEAEAAVAALREQIRQAMEIPPGGVAATAAQSDEEPPPAEPEPDTAPQPPEPVDGQDEALDEETAARARLHLDAALVGFGPEQIARAERELSELGAWPIDTCPTEMIREAADIVGSIADA